jgi:Ca2+-binding EF-hand superfamily protein
MHALSYVDSLEMSDAAIDRLFYKSATPNNNSAAPTNSTLSVNTGEQDDEQDGELGVDREAFLKIIAKQLRSVTSDNDHLYQSISDMMSDRSKTMDYARFLTHSSIQVGRMSIALSSMALLLQRPPLAISTVRRRWQGAHRPEERQGHDQVRNNACRPLLLPLTMVSLRRVVYEEVTEEELPRILRMLDANEDDAIELWEFLRWWQVPYFAFYHTTFQMIPRFRMCTISHHCWL